MTLDGDIIAWCREKRFVSWREVVLFCVSVGTFLVMFGQSVWIAPLFFAIIFQMFSRLKREFYLLFIGLLTFFFLFMAVDSRRADYYASLPDPDFLFSYFLVVVPVLFLTWFYPEGQRWVANVVLALILVIFVGFSCAWSLWFGYFYPMRVILQKDDYRVIVPEGSSARVPAFVLCMGKDSPFDLNTKKVVHDAGLLAAQTTNGYVVVLSGHGGGSNSVVYHLNSSIGIMNLPHYPGVTLNDLIHQDVPKVIQERLRTFDTNRASVHLYVAACNSHGARLGDFLTNTEFPSSRWIQDIHYSSNTNGVRTMGLFSLNNPATWGESHWWGLDGPQSQLDVNLTNSR